MPLQLDFLTRIVNVRWGAGIFVGADEQGNIYYTDSDQLAKLDPKKPEQKAFEVSKPFVENTYHTISSATIDGKIVFVLVGEYAGRNDASPFEGGSGSVILASHDGKTWQKVLDKPFERHGDIGPPIAVGTEFVTRILYSVVYDADATVEGETKKGLFYAAAYLLREKQPAPTGTAAGDRMEGEVMYSSRDGLTWTEGTENLLDVSFEPRPEDLPSIIEPHCTKPENAGHVPDGLQAYDPTSEIFVGPRDVHVDFTGVYYDSFPPPSQVDIKGAEKPNNDVSMPCYAVASDGSMWIAVGGSNARVPANTAVADIASDGAGPWKQIFNESNKGPIVTITAQPGTATE